MALSSILAMQAKQKSVKNKNEALEKARKEEELKAKKAARDLERANKKAAEEAAKLAKAREETPDVLSTLEQDLMLVLGRLAKRAGMLKVDIDPVVVLGSFIEVTVALATNDTKKKAHYTAIVAKEERERKERAAARKSANVGGDVAPASVSGGELESAPAADGQGGDEA